MTAFLELHKYGFYKTISNLGRLEEEFLPKVQEMSSTEFISLIEGVEQTIRILKRTTVGRYAEKGTFSRERATTRLNHIMGRVMTAWVYHSGTNGIEGFRNKPSSIAGREKIFERYVSQKMSKHDQSENLSKALIQWASEVDNGAS